MTTFRMLDDAGFGDADAERLVDLARVERRAGSPLGRHDAVLLEPGEKPRRWLRGELASHLRGCGLSTLARRLDRVPVPQGHVPVVLAGNEVKLRVCPIDRIVELDESITTVEAAPTLACFAVRRSP